jgi:Ser/Thr protein kinase RdoA (MazF antagonist)
LKDRKREKFAPDELAVVLSRYGLGAIESITEFTRGSRKSPKVGIVCQEGKFLLKRRSASHVSPRRIRFTHALQAHLAQKGFPLPQLRRPLDEDAWALHYNRHVYELFDYVRGHPYTNTYDETRDSGATLARFHLAVADFVSEEEPIRINYHDSNPVRTGLQSMPTTLLADETVAVPQEQVQELVHRLDGLYEGACRHAEAAGLRSWPEVVIHSDWHPGNMLFRNDRVEAVIDYDSVRFAQRVIDLANGVLQFSILTANQVQDWPDEIDESHAAHFLAGYRQVSPITPAECSVLPSLMIEAIIAESVLPVAATGSFGRFQGFGFIQMVGRKAAWLAVNAARLAQLFTAP